jgi:hypothetical protein
MSTTNKEVPVQTREIEDIWVAQKEEEQDNGRSNG